MLPNERFRSSNTVAIVRRIEDRRGGSLTAGGVAELARDVELELAATAPPAVRKTKFAPDMDCFWPFSKISKSSALRSGTILPSVSVTVTSTWIRSGDIFTTAASSSGVGLVIGFCGCDVEKSNNAEISAVKNFFIMFHTACKRVRTT